MTFYFLVRGRPPFEGDDIYELVMRQCNEDPPPLTGTVADWTGQREVVLQRMIAKDCAARFQNYDQLLEELDAEAPRPLTLAGFMPRVSAQILDILLLTLVASSVFLISVNFASDVSFDSGRYLKSNQFAQMPTILLSLMIVAGYVICIGRWGTTPGKWNMGLKVIRSGKQRVGYGCALIRLLVFNPGLIGGLSWSILLLVSPTTKRAGVWLWILSGIDLLGFILLLTSSGLILFSARRRGLHDFAAGTKVVQLPERRKPRRWFQKLLSLRR